MIEDFTIVKSSKMLGFKIFGPGLKCRGFQYSTIKPNIYKGELVLRSKGLHFCTKAINCLRYYDLSRKNTYATVESGDEYIAENGDIVCRKLVIVKVLTYEEFQSHLVCAINTPSLYCTTIAGKLNGRFLNFHPNKTIKLDTNFSDDAVNSAMAHFNDKGELTKFIDENGKEEPIQHVLYHPDPERSPNDDICITTTVFWTDKDGNGMETTKLYVNCILKVERVFCTEKDTEVRTFFWPNKQAKCRIELKGNKRHGSYDYWSQNGVHRKSRTYHEGKRQGRHMAWTESKILVRDVEYDDNKLHGRYNTWHTNGSVHRKYNHVRGKLHGKNDTFYKNGKQSRHQNYHHEIPDGRFIRWNKKGMKTVDLTMKDGIYHGEVNTWWHKSGKPHLKTLHYCGNRINSIEFLGNGQICDHTDENRCSLMRERRFQEKLRNERIR